MRLSLGCVCIPLHLNTFPKSTSAKMAQLRFFLTQVFRCVGPERSTLQSLRLRVFALRFHNMAGIIAIVGRPNVGKSALFNRLVGRRIAIVHDQPGVTRDRVSAEAEWQGRSFTLVDTGGIGLLRGEKASDVIINAALEQVGLAIESADVIILVVNVQEGIVPLDHEAAQRLRRSGKPVLVAVNKVDTHRAEGAALEFAELGFESIFPVSAIHGEGIEPLMNAATGLLPVSKLSVLNSSDDSGETAATEKEPIPPDKPLKLAIVGRPNVGKSSIINSLTQ